MVAAGVAVVDLHGAAHAGRLMPLFEGYLEKRPGAARGGLDEVRSGAIWAIRGDLGDLGRFGLICGDPLRDECTIATGQAWPSGLS